MTRDPYGTGWVPYGFVVLGVLVLLVVGAGLVTRAPVASVPEREAYLDAWSKLHGSVRPEGLVGWWLRRMYVLARPLARIGVRPAVLTASGVVLAGAVPGLTQIGARWPIVAGLAVALSAVFDTLDGAVAVLSHRTSAWGFVLDSLADRLSDVVYLVAFWLVGAAGWLCVVAGGALAMLEYARARAGSAGMPDVGVVTVGERPTRVIIASSFLVTAGIFCGHTAGIAAGGALATTVVSFVGLVQLLLVARRRLLSTSL